MYILGDFCLLNQKDDLTTRKKNEAIINTTIFLERKDISAKAISHHFLKRSLLPLPRCPHRQEEVSWRAQPQTNLTASLLFSFHNSAGSAHSAILQSPPQTQSVPQRKTSSPIRLHDPPLSCLQGGCSLCHKPVSGELGWKAQVSSRKTKKGLGAFLPWGSGCGCYTYSADLHPRIAMLGTSFRR